MLWIAGVCALCMLVCTGYECGIGIDSWQDIQVGDQLEVFEFVEVARKLSDSAKNDSASDKKADA